MVGSATKITEKDEFKITTIKLSPETTPKSTYIHFSNVTKAVTLGYTRINNRLPQLTTSGKIVPISTPKTERIVIKSK